MNSSPTDHRANRLINETSPYLLQHAHNPWIGTPGAEALTAADRDKPILFDGYSAMSLVSCNGTRIV